MSPFRPVVRSGGWFHVMNRGSGGMSILPRQGDGSPFVAGLGEISERLLVDIHAYCVMGTHYHLLARAEEAELRQAVAILESGLPGSVGRVRLRRMALGRHLLQVTRYIHRNPVEAGLVARPEDWPWSSYRGYLDRLECPPWLRTEAVLGWLGSYGPRQRYRRYVERGHGPLGSLREGAPPRQVPSWFRDGTTRRGAAP